MEDKDIVDHRLDHLGTQSQDILSGYRMAVDDLERLGVPTVQRLTQAERMRQIIATPELAQIIIPDADRTILVHSTDSASAEDILRTGLRTDSLTGINTTATPLEWIQSNFPSDRQKEVIKRNLLSLTALGVDEGGGISGEAKVIIELPLPPEFGPEGAPKATIYGASDWTAQYVEPDEITEGRRPGAITDAKLPARYLRGCMDFKEQKYKNNSRFGQEQTSQHDIAQGGRGGIWRRLRNKGRP